MAATGRRLVPWAIVLLFLSALVLGCSSCLTLLSDYRNAETVVKMASQPPEEPEPEFVDVTLPPRLREDEWSVDQATLKPVDFFGSSNSRLQYN